MNCFLCLIHPPLNINIGEMIKIKQTDLCKQKNQFKYINEIKMKTLVLKSVWFL